eukprot:10757335-Alexandrium_andersonii.AAC.1
MAPGKSASSALTSRTTSARCHCLRASTSSLWWSRAASATTSGSSFSALHPRLRRGAASRPGSAGSPRSSWTL